jgi:hypothetical protein
MKKVLLALLVVVVIGIIVWIRTPDPKQRQGEHIQRLVEDFRQSQHRLPSSLNELGITDFEFGPIYYEVVDDRDYCLWYGTSLGESVSYNSTTRLWRDKSQCSEPGPLEK